MTIKDGTVYFSRPLRIAIDIKDFEKHPFEMLRWVIDFGLVILQHLLEDLEEVTSMEILGYNLVESQFFCAVINGAQRSFLKFPMDLFCESFQDCWSLFFIVVMWKLFRNELRLLVQFNFLTEFWQPPCLGASVNK